MPSASSLRFAVALASVALTAAVASAQPIHSNPAVRPAGPATRIYHPPGSFYRYGVPSSPRVVIGIGIGGGYGSGLYDPLGYGLGYSPFGYSGLGYGGLGYGSLGYGYAPFNRGAFAYHGSSFGVPVLPGTYALPPRTMTYRVVPVQPLPTITPEPQPQPLPLPQPAATGEARPATITVVTNDGAKVTFDDVAGEAAGNRHTFTTRPIAPGVETRVNVKVDGPGASSISIRVRGGESATVDLRK